MSESVVLEHLLSTTQNDQSVLSRPTRQRVYILPTREGFVLSIVLFAMLLGAVNYNNNMAYMLTFLLGSIFMIGIVHTYRNLAGLIITAAIPEPVFAGNMAVFLLIIDNHGGLPRPALNFLCQSRQKRKVIKNTDIDLPVLTDVQADQWQKIEIKKPANKRGLLPLGRVVISTRYPLGLFRAWSYIELDEKCIVYPKPVGNKLLPLPVTTQKQGQAGIKSGTDDFAGFRHYHAGDSIRNIAWKALAREQPLLVKRFSGNENRTLMLTWNDVVHLPDAELRLSQLCLWILQAELEGWSYGLDIPELRIVPEQGTFHRNQCLESLARFGFHHEK